MPFTETTANIIEYKIDFQCINVSYPRLKGLKDQPLQKKINELIRKKVLRLIPRESCEVYQEILGTYEVMLNEKGILSIRFEFYTFKVHAANGLTVVDSITVDLKTGQVYQLHDLFKTNSDYKIVISEIIKEQIKEQDLPLIKEFNTITDYEGFYMTEDSLVIYFQLFEYTPHAAGIPEFAIPYFQISNLVSNDSPVLRFID